MIALVIIRRTHKAHRTERGAENPTGPKLPDFTLHALGRHVLVLMLILVRVRARVTQVASMSNFFTANVNSPKKYWRIQELI